MLDGGMQLHAGRPVCGHVGRKLNSRGMPNFELLWANID